MELIKTENLSFTYPGCDAKALNGVSVIINKGEFVTVCGKSGCGKTTLLKHFKPILAPFGKVCGEIFFEGRDLLSLTNREQSEKIGFVMQNPEEQIVTDKVWHELAFGLESLGCPQEEIRARVAETASFFGIQDWYHKKTSELSGGMMQILNLAAVMVMKPSLLILDEPTSQLDPIAASRFIEALVKINRETGTTVILSEHRLEEAFPVSDKIIVMDNGGVLVTGTPKEVGAALKNANNDMYKALPTPMRVYYSKASGSVCPVTVREGRKWLEKQDRVCDVMAKQHAGVGDTVVLADNLWFRYEKNADDVIKGMSLEIKSGEIYALIGGNGTGKTTALSVLGGIYNPYRGKIKTTGDVAVLPQNPQTLFVKNTVSDELCEMTERDELISYVVSVCELGEILSKHPYDLSGGQMQRVALAKVLLKEPDILLLDEPTKGFDAHYKMKFADILRKLKNGGITVILVSHDIEFCAEIADRCGMMFDGKIVSEGTPQEFFAGKSFYTTAASRMSAGIIENAVLAEDIIYAIGGEREKHNADSDKLPPPKKKCEKAQSKTSKKRLWVGGLFGVLYVITCLLNINAPDTGMYSATLQLVGTLFVAASFLSFFAGKGFSGEIRVVRDKKTSKYALVALAVMLVIVPITIYFGKAFLGDRKYYFISLLIILETLLPFLFVFEKRKPQARELVLISVLCGISVAGRTAFYMLPQFKPVLALVIISGICFGSETGFLVGAVTGFVSNFFFGQGPWTPWQMFAFGIVGFGAGIVFKFIKITRLSLCVFGLISAVVLFGVVVNFGNVIVYQMPTAELIKAALLSGLPFDLIHGIATAFFLWCISEPMITKISRVKHKYGLMK